MDFAQKPEFPKAQISRESREPNKTDNPRTKQNKKQKTKNTKEMELLLLDPLHSSLWLPQITKVTSQR